MSFVGTLALTGLGSLIYKYDTNQIFEKHPNVELSIKEYYSKVYKKEAKQLSERYISSLVNFFPGVLDGYSLAYPFRGCHELLKNLPEYSMISLWMLTGYLLMFSLTGFAYWATITPMYIALFGILGPPGILIVILHSFIHINMLTMMYMRMAHYNNKLVMKYLNVHGVPKSFTKIPVKYYIPFFSTYYWLYEFPSKLIKYTCGTIVLLVLMTFSTIPLFGPLFFNIVISPVITRIYVSKYLRLRGVNNIQRYEHLYENFGSYTAFGLSCAIIESIPIVSGFALCSNTLAAVMWGIKREELN
ncbi:hypothetical protein TBLA_0A04710 [Henningerozyma blattae CBS 6284]|uniref:Uncharacterized protein n=1 Tax=Henningerozyma blattae (strain ATCC 34711 / CBS 6284 / DSM 70876 / NBRC 10599 / NRRL Y-10934 / UCD 77-7) TaxID=1071380 RepID=I2GVW2_HENB6|nr:hypothetical protein TBLA_0A04710 [Tetrapisispora blattae CBS 6284]CCH58264.1 hypothetical protein TBLA_0A04710 [Tetrapisispora blattae CBS 6284]